MNHHCIIAPLLVVALFFAQAEGQLGLTLGGLGNTLDGVTAGGPSYAPPNTAQHQIVKLPSGQTVVIPIRQGKSGGLVNLGDLVGGLGLLPAPLQQTVSLTRLPLGRKKRFFDAFEPFVDVADSMTDSMSDMMRKKRQADVNTRLLGRKKRNAQVSTRLLGRKKRQDEVNTRLLGRKKRQDEVNTRLLGRKKRQDEINTRILGKRQAEVNTRLLGRKKRMMMPSVEFGMGRKKRMLGGLPGLGMLGRRKRQDEVSTRILGRKKRQYEVNTRILGKREAEVNTRLLGRKKRMMPSMEVDTASMEVGLGK